MPLSEKIRKGMEQGSWVRKMFEEGIALKKQYGQDNVFDLSLGNPEMEPPPEFHRELKKLASSPITGMHRYMENAGYPETRTAVASHLSVETGISFTMNDIVMTCGAAGALNVVLKTILNPGDEVILFAPYFTEYANYIDNHNGISRVMPTDDMFIPRLDVFESAIGPRTKAILINSPNNPTGVVYSDDFIHELGELLRRKEVEHEAPIFLIGDAPYSKLVYDGQTCPQIWSHYVDSIMVTSHSKDLALPGERIGYIAIHPDCNERNELMNGFIYCNRTLGYVNAPALMQRLVNYLQDVTIPIAKYQQKRDFLYQHLTKMGYSIVKPQGAFYMFPRSPLEDDVAFVRELQQLRVLTAPGCGFGSPGYFRIAYCVDDKVLEGSLEGFRQTAQKFKLS